MCRNLESSKAPPRSAKIICSDLNSAATDMGNEALEIKQRKHKNGTKTIQIQMKDKASNRMNGKNENTNIFYLRKFCGQNKQRAKLLLLLILFVVVFVWCAHAMAFLHPYTHTHT